MEPADNNKKFEGQLPKNPVPHDERMNLKPFPPARWSSSSMQAYNNFGSTLITNSNPAGYYSYPSTWWPSQRLNYPLQFGSPYDQSSLSNYPMAARVGLLGAPLAFPENVRRFCANRNLMNSMNRYGESSQPISLAPNESIENWNRSSIPRNNWEGPTWSAASESMRSPLIGFGPNNVCGANSFFKGAPLSFSEHMQMICAEKNGKSSSIPRNNREGLPWSVASESMRSPIVGLDTRESNSFLKNFPFEKQESSMMLGNGEDTEKKTSVENSVHVEANPTEQNQNLGTSLNTSGTDPKLGKQEGDVPKKKRKRVSKEEGPKVTRPSKEELVERKRIRRQKKRQRECEDLQESMNNLIAENSELKKKLISLSEECVELRDENDSIMEELVEKYGADQLTNLMNLKPT